MPGKFRALTRCPQHNALRADRSVCQTVPRTAEARAIAMMVQEHCASIRHPPTPFWKVCRLHACPSCRLCYEACPKNLAGGPNSGLTGPLCGIPLNIPQNSQPYTLKAAPARAEASTPLGTLHDPASP